MSNLDTRNKRGSAIGIDAPWRQIYPNPDGTIDQQDRQQIAYKYQGISATPPASFVPAWALPFSFTEGGYAT